MKQKKTCFVTVGATAAFDSLIRAVLSPSFLEALKATNYTDLLLQHGKEGAIILEDFDKKHPLGSDERFGIKILGFDFNHEGLGREMQAAKGEGYGAEGVVLSHAGSGSILQALRIAVPLVVVPNPTLLDNHQEELAEELAAQGYVIHGQLDNLASAIKQSETLRLTQRVWPPAKVKYDPSGRGLAGVMDDEMGFVD